MQYTKFLLLSFHRSFQYYKGKYKNLKLNYIYILTPKGIAIKTKLTINFMKRKMKEYEQLEKEYKKLKK